MPAKDDTKQWLELYEGVLFLLAENLADPKKWADRMGIDPTSPGMSDHMQQKLSIERYHEMMKSWRTVRVSIEMFGLELSDDIMLAPAFPSMTPKQLKDWEKNPFLEISREGELGLPMRFVGRDAFTALGFMNFYIQHCENVNPKEYMKKRLEAQGITKDNFYEQVGYNTYIKNPWADE